jgi:acetyl esterase/lipase
MTTSACAGVLLLISVLLVCPLNVTAQQPSPSPSPSATASPSPSPTATPTPDASPTPRDPMSTPTFNGLRLRSIGPAFTSGRIVGFAVEPNNPTRYYVAVASGGVWKTTNAGVTWTPVFDNEASYSIGAITLDPKNPNVGASVVFYGGHPNVKPDLPNLHAPVLGLYAEKDGFVTPQSVRELESKLKALGKSIDVVIYPGTDHAFFNDSRPEVYNEEAAADAWQRTVDFLHQHLGEELVKHGSA